MRFLATVLNKHILSYPSPKYLNYNWGAGSVLGLLLTLQIITGLFLSFYYRAADIFAFSDIMYIINDVHGGYIFKYLHLNGATFIFIFLYFHMFRGIYYRSYAVLPKVWLSGIVLFVLMILTAFLGYVLPWGQMSYWAATVITNLVTSLPVVGSKIIVYIHGAFSVQSATLTRFFILHYLLAFVVALLAIYHIAALHTESSSNLVSGRMLVLPRAHFYYYFVYKDLFIFLCVCMALVVAAFQFPNAFNHPDNFIEANPLSTPSHIVPEWYFLPFYAILRAVPNKLFGVLAMLASLVVLALLPLLSTTVLKTHNLNLKWYESYFWLLVFIYVVLGYLGSMPAEAPYVVLSQYFTVAYFTYFFGLYLMRWAHPVELFIRRVLKIRDYDSRY